MCGIVAYLGHRNACEIILKGLKRLEYRGYDSAGIALVDNQQLNLYKMKGKVSDLKEFLLGKDQEGTTGIGHTRWATHGEPSDRNAHPHVSTGGRLAIIHNGIIENYNTIKQELIQKGYTFSSDTDSEVVIHFIEDILINKNCSVDEAVRLALTQIVGAYAIVIADRDDPDTLIAARKGSPLVIGIGEYEYFVASDATPIVEYTKDVVYLNDHEIAIIRRDGLKLKSVEDISSDPYIQKIDLELETIEKGGFPHFMLKEIFEQPRSVSDAMRGRLNADSGRLVLGGIREYAEKLINADRIIIVACGTSWHAGLVAEYFFEEWCRIPIEVEYASEFRYRNPVIRPGDVVIAISQSGETADTLAAIELAKSKGAIIFGVVNVVGSSIARTTHEGAYIHIGPEIGVASTKAFTGQVVLLAMMALMISRKKGTISEAVYLGLLNELTAIPGKIAEVLALDNATKEIAGHFKDARNFLYLGRGYNFPVALEGALKLKEISYIHAEGYPAAEMKHGPIALIDAEMPVVFIATRDSSYEKIISNIQEVKARKGRVIAIITQGDTLIPQLADYTLEVPVTHEALMPLVSVIPLQLLSYYIADLRGCNVDQPRNLAKSVTVE